jgi:succinate dehydrogenase / fumarate reductase cytochrome b subunit
MSAVASRSLAKSSPWLSRSTRLGRLLSSSIGLKLVMALTGVLLSAFVLVHMLGNLQVFQGAEAIDAYGRLLRKEPAILWLARLILLGAVGLHIAAFVALRRMNSQARAQGYRVKKNRESSFASRSMIITGPLLLGFIVFHILHLTTGTVHPNFTEGAVYQNLVIGLKGLVGVVYLIAMALLAFHLWHGVWSMFQTLGVPEDRFRSPGRRFATIFTLVVTLGFASVPLAIMLGFVQ